MKTDNTNFLSELVLEINSYDGSLYYLEVYSFDEDFFELFFKSPIEVSRATYFGKIGNWNDEYIRFNGYGNLESLNQWEREAELLDCKDEIIERALELENEINLKDIIKRYS